MMGTVTFTRLLYALLLPTLAVGCILCPLRVPPRPRPIDQFQLPSIPKLPSLEKAPPLCNISRGLPVGEQCGAGFSNLLCSAEKLSSALLGGCPGPEDPEQCSRCAYDKSDNFWVVQWFDSLGKPPAGVSDGNYYWLGDYEICHDLRNKKKFSGQYCRVELEVPDVQVESGCPQTDPLQIILGVCFPSQCSAAELARVAQSYLPYNVTVDCELPVEWSLGAQIFLGVSAIWIGVVLLATVAHIREPDIPLIVYCLSLKVNGAKALSTKRDYTLHAHQGLEFITFLMIVIGMVYNYMLPYIENVAFVFDGVSSASMHMVNNYSYQVDGLLALCSLFSTSLLMGHVSCIKDMINTVFRKIVKFWPSYAYIIGFMSVVFANVASGPMWIHSETVERCERSWWKNLLLINNFFPVRDTCVDFGYIISLEAQFFCVLLILICVAYHRPTLAQWVAALLLLTSVVLTFVRVFLNHLPPAPILTAEPIQQARLEELLNTVLTPFLTRLSPYMVGFLFYFFFKFDHISDADSQPSNTDRVNNSNPAIAWLMLSVIAALMGMVAFYLLPYASSNEGSRLSFALYASLHRPAWAFAVIGILWLCQHKSFKEMNSFLSWRLFSPLSKLTFQALILSEPLILYFFSALHRPSHATHWSTLYAAVSTAALSYLSALLLDIFLARPFRNILYSKSIHRRRHTIPGPVFSSGSKGY